MSMRLEGFRLSPQQRHVWRLQADSRAYRAQSVLLLEGALDRPALRRAVEKVVARHGILRTAYRRAPGVRYPLQVPLESADSAEGAPLLWQEEELEEAGSGSWEAAIDDLFERAGRRPFDLEQGPWVHAWLAGLGREHHALVLVLPALAADAASLLNLEREISEAYADPDGGVGEPALEYLQFSEWQNQLLEDEESRPGRDLWLGRRPTAPASLRLPHEVSAQAGGFAPARVAVPLGPRTGAALSALADARGTALDRVLAAAWHGLLWRLTGEGSLTLGVVFDGRQQEPLGEGVGLFARCLAVPVSLGAGDGLGDLVSRLAESWNESEEWQDFFSPDDGEAGSGGPAAAFAYLPATAPWKSGGIRWSPGSRLAYHERFKACLVATGEEEGLGLEVHYDSRLLSAEAATALAERCGRFLAVVAAEPATPLGEVDLLGEEERRRLLVEINDTVVAPVGEELVHRLFAAQAARTPEAVAVEMGERRLTYAELESRANRLAHRLLGEGITPGTVVGISMVRSPEMVVAVLGTLKAGGAYLPLDPNDPPERLSFLALDAGAERVLTLGATTTAQAGSVWTEERILPLDDAQEETSDRPQDDPGVEVPPESLAYVLYTSGSTGVPKGVMVPHGALVNYLRWAGGAYRVGEGSGAPLHSALGFDLTVTSLFTPLLAGGRVTLLPEEQGIEALAGFLASREGTSLLKLTPAHLGLLAQALEGSDLAGRIDCLVLGGEALLAEGLRRWRQEAPATRLLNEYGPTETVVGCTVYELPAAAPPSGAVPIGRPIANTRVYLLDRRGRLVPEGVMGELYVGGAGVTRGYLGRRALTAERFVPDPFAAEGGEPGGRLYRTGDLVRFLPGGDLEFLGRADHQVKVRGHRVELGEVEVVLSGHPAVREAVVALREDTPGERRLVAYLVADGGEVPGVEELRRFLGGKLPEPMIPAAYVPLASLPLNANGKVDRVALPAPGSERPALEKEYVAPRTPLEETLVEVWQEVLGLDKVGVLDSFFALGGDSIRSVRAVALAKERGIETSVEQLFQHQTIESLARELETAPAAAGEAERLARLVEELEGLSEEEVQARLQQEGPAVSTAEAEKGS